MIKCKPKLPPSKSTQSGFTIIESLIAIIVVTILMIGISPVLTLSVAARVQARRIELATQASRDYIDGVRSGAIPIPNQTILLDEYDETETNPQEQFQSQRDDFAAIAAPNNNLPPCTDPTTEQGYCQNAAKNTVPQDGTPSLYCVDGDGGGCTSDSNKDLIIQAFRSVSPSGADPGEVSDEDRDGKLGYLLGIRVYRADGFNNDGGSLANEGTQGSFTGGLGDRKTPLAQMITEIPPERGFEATDANKAYDEFCARLGGCS